MSANLKGIVQSEFCDKPHKNNDIKYFRSKMLSRGSQLEERSDLRHLNAVFSCVVNTSAV